jgi:hypothetical protein
MEPEVILSCTKTVMVSLMTLPQVYTLVSLLTTLNMVLLVKEEIVLVRLVFLGKISVQSPPTNGFLCHWYAMTLVDPRDGVIARLIEPL